MFVQKFWYVVVLRELHHRWLYSEIRILPCKWFLVIAGLLILIYWSWNPDLKHNLVIFHIILDLIEFFPQNLPKILEGIFAGNLYKSFNHDC